MVVVNGSPTILRALKRRHAPCSASIPQPVITNSSAGRFVIPWQNALYGIRI
jgi:hypothetical protein